MKMGFKPENVCCGLNLQIGGAILGCISIIASIVGLVGGTEKFREVMDIFGFGIFTIRSISGTYS